MKQTLTKTRIAMTLLVVCFVLMLGIVFASPTFAAYAVGEDGTAPTIVKTGGIDVDRENNISELPVAIAGKPYKAADGSNYKIEATGTEPFTFHANKWGEGGYSPLPEGLSLNPTTGEIEGTPKSASQYRISVTVTNKYGSDNVLVRLHVYEEDDKPKITTTQADIAVGYKNSSYMQEIKYTTGSAFPPEASITGLPAGLSLRRDGHGIYIAGTPTVTGSFPFTVRVENALGFDEKTYIITIQEGYQSPKIINKDDIRNEPAIKGKYFEFQFVATGTNAADNPFLFFTYLNQFDESTPNAQGEYELGNGLFLTKEGKVYGTPVSTGQISFSVGVKTKNLYGDYEESGFGTGNCYVPVYENGQITGVTISPENTSVPKGGQRQFTATVIGYGDFDKSVTWDIYDYSAGTTISQDGVLTVGIDETATTIRVEARSKGDTNILKEIPVTIINHTHTTTFVLEKPKTCTTDGNIEHYKCNVCGDLFEDAGAVNQLTEEKVKIPAGHEYGDLVPKQEPTCTQTGMQAHYKCSVCNKYFDESKTEKNVEELTIPVNPNAHDFGAWIAEVPATCVATGTKGHKDCNRCNRYYDESGNEITDLIIPTNDNHDWNAWVSNGDGTHTRTCKRDSSHKENGTCSGGTATCTNKAVCDFCRRTYGDTAPHDYGELIPEVAATTTEFGVKEHKDCSVCGKHFDKDGNEITELKIAKIGTHNVIVNGESKFYAHGESVTVTANEPSEGKVFTGWQDESGKIVSTEKSYTFTVNGETTLTAVYEDTSSGGEITPPAKKDGLSGGQIAGIVIGTLLFAGIGGFAIFWFAIKKKNFKDLGEAFKRMGEAFKRKCEELKNKSKKNKD
ncbi:MAG: putative Ig domain-containing protein [Clostridia bacterium]|nr:putative Ig domain-containing protein [Clostridia bacterium]